MTEASSPLLEIRGLTRRFGALIANEDVSIDVCEGEVHALIGPNGAGKSTLIKQIAGELRSDSGSVLLDGRDVTALGAVERARAGLARSFQVSSIAPGLSALQNLMLAVQGNSGITFRFFKPALDQSELRKPAETLAWEFGLGEVMNLLAGELSHGQRRQLEIAMALALEPKVFLLDEPLAGVDTGGSLELTRQFSELKKRAPILLVEHDMQAVFALADRISVLVNGRVIASGPPDEIRTNEQVRDAYLGAVRP